MMAGSCPHFTIHDTGGLTALCRFTVPVLWDKKTKQIVNNESSEIIRIFNTAFNHLLSEEFAKVDLYPAQHRAEIDELNEWVYDTVNSASDVSLIAFRLTFQCRWSLQGRLCVDTASVRGGRRPALRLARQTREDPQGQRVPRRWRPHRGGRQTLGHDCASCLASLLFCLLTWAVSDPVRPCLRGPLQVQPAHDSRRVS